MTATTPAGKIECLARTEAKAVQIALIAGPAEPGQVVLDALRKSSSAQKNVREALLSTAGASPSRQVAAGPFGDATGSVPSASGPVM
jgi:hypothetical protein